MSQHSPEETVRRATAAFNGGRPDEARKLCEQGLGRAPGEPMLHHLLAAVLFSQGGDSGRARPCREQPQEAARQRRRAIAGGADRACGKGF